MITELRYNLVMKNLLLSVHPFMWVFIVISSLLFVIFPQIDLYISGLFFDNGFYLNHTFFEQVLYHSVKPLLIGLFGLGTLLWLYNRKTKKALLRFGGKQLIYIMLVAGIGSGLIVNDLLKDHWGRARPAETIQFGGEKTFTPAFIISDQDGYSFSCGHGSGAFILIAVALLFYRHKNLALGVALSYGFLVSFVRLIAGGHFFSDIMVSFFIMWIVSKILYYVMFEREYDVNKVS